MSEPRYLLLPKPGFSPERFAASLREHGLQLVEDGKWDQPRRWSDEAEPDPSTVEYWEDRTLGIGRIQTFGPRAEALRSWCAERWPCWSPTEALALADGAHAAADKVATLAPLAAVVEVEATLEAPVLAILRTRLADEVVAVRRAALLVLASLPSGEGAGLLRALVDDPQLGVAARRYRAAGAAGEPAGEHADSSDPAALQQRAEVALQSSDSIGARRLLERALQLAPLASSVYAVRAEVSVAEGRVWPAMIDVTTALALARRHGVHLQVMQELQTRLRAELLAAATPPTAAVELQAVAQLVKLLRAGRLHEVEEIAETLLPLPGRPALWWLAIGLGRWERGRIAPAGDAFEAALAADPDLAAAHFLLGQCRLALGDSEGALGDFARLDPVAAGRPAQPSLLAVYADELLGVQAPWEAREHAFTRVQLLREHGRLADALAVITELLRREPPAADALLAQGVLFGELGQPAAALIVLDQALAALRPEERLLADEDPLGTLQWHRAAALHALGDKEGATAARHTAQRLGAEPVVPPAAGDPALTAPADVPGAAAYAELRRIAQQDFLPLDPAGSLEDAGARSSRTLDAPIAQAAFRAQVAELLVAALGALDTQADADTGRALIQRAWRGFQALGQLAPQHIPVSAMRAIVEATASALGLAAATVDLH